MTAPLDDADTDDTTVGNAASEGDEPQGAREELAEQNASDEEVPEEETAHEDGPEDGPDEEVSEEETAHEDSPDEEVAAPADDEREVATADEAVDTPGEGAVAEELSDEEADGQAVPEPAAGDVVSDGPQEDAGDEVATPVGDKRKAVTAEEAVNAPAEAAEVAAPGAAVEVNASGEASPEGVSDGSPAEEASDEDVPDGSPAEEASDEDVPDGSPAEDASDEDVPDDGVEDAEPIELPPSYPPTVRPVPLPVPGSQADADDEAKAQRPRRGSTLAVVVLVLILTALIKTFVFQTFEIPSSSMESTLETGDRVVVTMYDSDSIDRGDIVVFRDPAGWLNVTDPTGWRGLLQDALVLVRLLPEDTGHHLIKRVIGLPGDHVVADSTGALSVNGVAVDETYIKDGASASDVPFDVVVPEGCVWVMGDNRANSLDSRYHQDDPHGGAVPLSDVVGVAKVVLWPLSHWETLNEGEAVFAGVSNAPATTDPGSGQTP